MSKISIEKSKLEGVVKLSGAKNSVLRLLAASLLTDEKIILTNYPSNLLDAQIHLEMLERLGKKCTLVEENKLIIESDGGVYSDLLWEDRSIRNTLLILGALVTKTGSGSVPLPGGCQLGDRSFDLHELVLKNLGADVWVEEGKLLAKSNKNTLIGANIVLPLRSTGATENAIISSCLAKGVTKIWNPHIRPEILDLIAFLNRIGAKIKVFGQEHIEVIGVEALSGGEYAVMPDNMEAITWLVASVITNGDIEIIDFPFNDLEVALCHLKESGARFYRGHNSVIVRGGNCYPLEISTGPHPGINSDVQPIMAAYAACANGESRIVDLRFPGRYGYAEELKKMGIDFKIEGNLLKIFGNGGRLVGADVKALDLRAGAALALCGLVAEGKTIINDYQKLNQLGGIVEIIE
jgi:UDP-N-acetylglucosamine 1-carboxyvinyltransferase